LRRGRTVELISNKEADRVRLVVSQFMSVDGIAQAPGGLEEDTDGGFTHGGWSLRYFDPEIMGGAVGAAMDNTDCLLFGRRTWQTMAAAWPARAGDPFAARMNDITKYVATRTLSQDDLGWDNSRVLPAGDLKAAVSDLKREPGRDVQVIGSLSIARELIRLNLVDEYRLMIEPITLGGGKNLFPHDGVARPLELINVTTATTGVQICVYHPAEDVS
jgi:dihydrofolate reductase